jgi:hypothetical protein
MNARTAGHASSLAEFEPGPFPAPLSRTGIILARNESTGQRLARPYGYAWRTNLDDARPGLLINATPVGMAGGPQAETARQAILRVSLTSARSHRIGSAE